MIQILTKLDKTLPKLYPDFTQVLFYTLYNIEKSNEIEDKAIEWYLAYYETSSVSRAYNHSQGLSRKRKVLDFWWGYLKTCSH